MSALGTPENPLRVAIVGSGPAGFYAAEHLLKQEDVAVEVDMFDRLPTPYGLVRAGVAPDHPKIKSVIRMYEKTAAREGFRFFGNVDVGTQVTVADLSERYHAVIYAYGSATDRQLGHPRGGPARQTRGDRVRQLVQRPPGLRRPRVRPLLQARGRDRERERRGGRGPDAGVDPRASSTRPTPPITRSTPMAESDIEEIVVLGRRGPAQAAFTNPEVRELGEMLDADIVVEPAEVELDEISREYVESEDCDPTNRRNVEIFTDFSGREPDGKRRRIVLRFLRSPIEIKGDGRVQSIVVGSNRLERADDGRVRAVDTGEREEIECGLVLRSIGYKGIGLDGLPFDDERGVIPNDHGRVIDPESDEQVPGQYVVGWIKRGPSGVIGTNKKDAQDTVAALLEDVAAGRVPEAARGQLAGGRRGVRRRARARLHQLRRLARDRSRRGRPGRAAWPPARQVHVAGRDARSGEGGRGRVTARSKGAGEQHGSRRGRPSGVRAYRCYGEARRDTSGDVRSRSELCRLT